MPTSERYRQHLEVLDRQLADALERAGRAGLRLEGVLGLSRRFAGLLDDAAGRAPGFGESPGETLLGLDQAVQLARRACDHAEPERILVPAVVRDLCIGKTFRFVDIGEVRLKGFAEPVRLFDVAWA